MSRKIENKHNIQLESDPAPCPFCLILENRASHSKIAENDIASAIMSLEGHPIVISKKHLNFDIINNPEIGGKMFELALSLVPALQNVTGLKDFNIFTNFGPNAGQKIPHAHIHITTREEGDRKIRFNAQEEKPRIVLDEFARKLREFIEEV